MSTLTATSASPGWANGGSAGSAAGPRRAAPGRPESSSSGSASNGTQERRGRGKLVLAARVVEKIAAQAASEVSSSRGRSGGVLGIGAAADAAALPKVNAELSADSVDLDLDVGIAYPGSLRAAAQQVRDRVREQVEGLTGVAVHRVDIDITFLTLGQETGRSGTGDTARAAAQAQRKRVLR